MLFIRLWKQCRSRSAGFREEGKLALSWSLYKSPPLNESWRQKKTWDQRVASLRLTACEVTVLSPWARHIYPLTVQVQDRKSTQHDWTIVDWDVKSQHKQTVTFVSFLIFWVIHVYQVKTVCHVQKPIAVLCLLYELSRMNKFYWQNLVIFITFISF